MPPVESLLTCRIDFTLVSFIGYNPTSGIAYPSPNTSLFDLDPISELPELSNYKSSEESDTADNTIDDTERKTFYTPIPDYIKSPRLRDMRYDFF